MSFNDKKFSEIIKKLIKFKSSTTRIPIKDVSWEELIWATLVFIYGGSNVEWDSQSHEKSVDVKANIDNVAVKISAKGGIIKNELLTISSYRLTSFNKLKDRLSFIKNQHENFDFYLICARNVDSKKGITHYTILRVPPTKFAPPSILLTRNWKKTKGGYELKINPGFKVKIVSKMSNQLWYSIPLDYFSNDEKLTSVSIPNDKLGDGLIEFLKNNTD
ncbi:MAG: hypothetical protein KGJ89_02095 [Patescibacteria group bacterium]|nr:hypothetical protein [Patescibacteria group bacterium]MDE2015668.1 hypothetical protein [Patescibacteria group bacterium]MDE2226725.1 hypothetical protein [Patescibacteria group bacterium]